MLITCSTPWPGKPKFSSISHQPWHENISKRQEKSTKIYFRDTGLLHSLLDLRDFHAVTGHPLVGASLEGFAMEQIVRALRLSSVFYWATDDGAEFDIFSMVNGTRYGIEFKLSEAPDKTKSMAIATESLKIDRLLIVYPGEKSCPVSKKVTVCPISKAIKFLLGLTKWTE